MFKRYVYVKGLTNLIGSNGNYLINNDGQIKDIKGNDIPFIRDKNNNKVVHCSSWDGERDYRIIDLVAIQFKSLYIPISDYDKIIAFCIDNNSDNTRASNIGYRFKNGILEYVNRAGFYYVPGFTSIAINKDGDTVSVITNQFKTYYITKPILKKNIKGGYANTWVSILGTRGVIGSRHRFLYLVFKEYPNNADTMVVNHINGIPGDDRLENLEWVTRSQNNYHAYRNDLRGQNQPVLTRNVLTGKITEYYSISECARVLGYSGESTMNQRINTSKFGQVFQDGTQVKLKSDSRDWVIPTDAEKELLLAQEHIEILVRNCKTLEVTKYNSVTDAGKYTSIKHDSIFYRLNVDNRSPLFGYQFKKASDTRDFPNFTIEEYENSLLPNNFEVDARNLLTDETLEFSSIREAAKFIQRDIIHSFNLGRQPLFESGWQFKLKKDNWLSSNDFDKEIYRTQNTVMCKEETTGNIIIANDCSKLSQLLNLDRKIIRQVAFTRGNKVYKGYRFRLGATTEPWPTTINV